MPSGTFEANQKYQDAVEKTKAPAEPGTNFGTPGPGGSLPPKSLANPKTGDFVSKLAKGHTEASSYDPRSFGGSSRG
ncbi:hypothetical protein GGS20DRAFT_173764 [Poronia punctata]|nr:hypothetical protein GGS20DRAFT_173764 [Poronia punctata]